MIFAWEEVKERAGISFDMARTTLLDRLCNYSAMRDTEVCVVFDAYKVDGNSERAADYHGITVVYTGEGETADSYIERVSRELAKKYRLRVATSDNLEQLLSFMHGAERITAPELLKETEAAEADMRKLILTSGGRIDRSIGAAASSGKNDLK